MISHSPEETTAIGLNLSLNLDQPSAVICLYGDLGGGKTTFVKGVAQALGIKKRGVKSPTFVLMHEYRAQDKTLIHVDCYRIRNPAELFSEIMEMLGREKTWIIIEWAERLKGFLPDQRVEVYFEHVSENKRNITVKNLYENTR